MTRSSDQTPRPASTIILARDLAGAAGKSGAGFEVFMVRRHKRLVFVPDVYVFPGGRVDHADRHAVMRDVSAGHEALTNEEVAYRVCAIREAFEEAGILLAYAEDGVLVETNDQLAAARDHLNAGDFGFIDLIDELGLKLALDRIQPIARWITPPGEVKRFDTHFFLARAPEGQDGAHCGQETVASVWISPGAALQRRLEGQFPMILPTRKTIERLGASASVAAAMMQARAHPVVPISPVLEPVSGGVRVSLPAEAGYPNPVEVYETPAEVDGSPAPPAEPKEGA